MDTTVDAAMGNIADTIPPASMAASLAARKGCAAPTVPVALDGPQRAGRSFQERLEGRGAPTGADAPAAGAR